MSESEGEGTSDSTGQPGPSTWSGGKYPESEAEFPVGGVSWYEAAAYTRFAGMQLPTLEHWSRAATRLSREVMWMYIQTSNLNGTGVRRAGLGTANEWGLYDVAGNVREWCVNAIDSGRLTRGGTWEDSPFHISHLIAQDAFDRSAGNGFRVASFTDPAPVVARLSEPIRRSVPRDFRNVAPVSDVAFESIKRMFDYDAKPLEQKIEAEGETKEFRWQRVSFTAAYAGQRMVAYLYFPKNGKGPFEPVIYWGASNVVSERRFVPETQIYDAFANFIPQSGRALIVPEYQGSYERDDSTFSITSTNPDTTTWYRDLLIHRVNDLRRTIDYLEKRPDMRVDRIGYYGVSWGGQQAPFALAIEPRIKAAALYSAGYPRNIARSETEAFNYAPRVHQPVLMLNGRYDTVFPYETSQVPFFNQLGTPARDKKMEVSENGHIVPLPTTVKESLAWFDRYLSGK